MRTVYCVKTPYYVSETFFRWINEHPDLIWDYQPKCRGPGELGGKSVYTMTFNDVCDGQWASMM